MGALGKPREQGRDSTHLDRLDELRRTRVPHLLQEALERQRRRVRIPRVRHRVPRETRRPRPGGADSGRREVEDEPFSRELTLRQFGTVPRTVRVRLELIHERGVGRGRTREGLAMSIFIANFCFIDACTRCLGTSVETPRGTGTPPLAPVDGVDRERRRASSEI